MGTNSLGWSTSPACCFAAAALRACRRQAAATQQGAAALSPSLWLHVVPARQARAESSAHHHITAARAMPNGNLSLPCPPPLQPGSSPQRQRRQLDPRARQSEFKGLLSSFTGEDDDGLLDVRFERRGKGGSGGSSGKDAGGRKRR